MHSGHILVRSDTPTSVTEVNLFEDIFSAASRRDEKLQKAPPIVVALAALKDLYNTLYSSRNNKKGHKVIDIDLFQRVCMEGMQSLLALYTDLKSLTYRKWAALSLWIAVTLLCGMYCTWTLHKLVHKYMSNYTLLLINSYRNWNETMLVNRDLAQDINLYLQELEKDITTVKTMLFLMHSDIKETHEIMKKISLCTAQ
ncbi:uncharacterized protein BT62DRAFT_901460 [Guyanagaster necrorhizus]|uniref:Uncharacterized protein n=1 Tax=Guyanagaster necrorhizus TaxID=856835 RepID=A0A9P7VNS3_9AGAR|nr:uncharacterized protein BT62DRAFT_901460 [Guyanagaster necrorhizus MCA 3950]KAG7443933.1 hypothetical protein BT62DRAFT_901460 [Guyanagaster necrorhizus MCA 3950]